MARRLAAELLGTALVLLVILGSGVTAAAFANPVVALARVLRDTSTDIAPGAVPTHQRSRP